MLQAHSLLWHYLWIAPNVVLLSLGALLWRRPKGREFRAFCWFAILSAAGHLVLYAADVTPWVSPRNFWRICWASLLVDGALKFAVIGTIFARVFGSYSSISKIGRLGIRWTGGVLLLLATLTAAYARTGNPYWLITGTHLLEQTIYFVECGLLIFIFIFSAYFRISWDGEPFGIALGLGISACVHLGTWAMLANAEPSAHGRTLLDFLNMATYHACVLIWCYYLLVPHKVATKSAVPLPENNLAVWNRELERLLQP